METVILRQQLNDLLNLYEEGKISRQELCRRFTSIIRQERLAVATDILDDFYLLDSSLCFLEGYGSRIVDVCPLPDPFLSQEEYGQPVVVDIDGFGGER